MKTKEKFKKIGDWLLEAFLSIWLFLFCCAALKLSLGVIWMFGGLYEWFNELSWAVQIIISVAAGTPLFIYLRKRNIIQKKK